MAFRERIEAVLKVKDLARFKGNLKSAARSVKDFSGEAERNAATLEILRSIERRLGHQTEVLTVQTEMLAHAQDQQAQEALKAAGANEVLTKTVRRARGGIRDSITRWSFWKDRLSLTRSEIMTTTLTIGTYLLPALVAVGNSAVAAAMGGGAVAAAGLTSLITGFVLLGTVAKQMTNQVKKIMKAQDAYNLTVVQYGKGSKEAARQAAHMYAVIQQNGGKPMLAAANSLRNFKKAWTEATGGARVNEAKIMTQTFNRFRQLMPMVGEEVNMMSKSLKFALSDALKGLTGGEGQSTFKVLSNLFQDAIGPGVRGVTNIILVLSRIIRAAAPWALKFAKAFERVTFSWRRSTRDGIGLQHTIDNLVHHTQAWIGLGKELGRTLKIIFVDSKDRGGSLIVELTGVVKQFNDWLQAVSDAGKVSGLFDRYIRSLHDLVWAIQNPIDAVRRWLPVVMDTVATTLATHAPVAAGIFVEAFMNSGSWAQFLTVAFLMHKFGVFRSVGRAVGKMFVEPFVAAFVEGFAARFLLLTAGESALGRAMTTAGAASGRVFGMAFRFAIIGALTFGLYEWAKKHKGLNQYSGSKGWGELFKDLKNDVKVLRTGKTKAKPGERIGGIGPIAGKATGGLIPSGTMAMVGETGPELAHVGPGGAHISPLVGGGTVSGSGVQPMSIPPISVSDFVPPISVSVQIDKREIANAVASYQDYRRARRGQG